MNIEFAVKFMNARCEYETYTIKQSFEEALAFVRSRGTAFQIVRQRGFGFGATVRSVVVAQSKQPAPAF